MSVGPMTSASSVAATQLAQSKGGDAERVAQESSAQSRKSEGNRKAENASGIGETEADNGASDRDADGRRIWEIGPDGEKLAEEEQAVTDEPRQSRDPTCALGSTLDLSC